MFVVQYIIIVFISILYIQSSLEGRQNIHINNFKLINLKRFTQSYDRTKY